ncbi:MAG: DedA family protein [Patescibacteria group bacterium]
MFYIFTFLALLGTGVGLFPIPEDIIVLSAGVGIEQDIGNPFIVAVVILVGIIISDFIIFFLGRKYGESILNIKFISFFLPKKKVETVHKLFDNHNKKSVFVGRFMSGFRPVVIFIAGSSKMNSSSFIEMDFLASIVYIPLYLFLGYRFSYDINRLIKGFSYVYHALEIIIILTIIFWVVFRLSKRLLNGNNRKIE